MRVRGVARVDRRTKNLLCRVRSGEIAIIDHEDIDQVACESLARAGVRAVVNAKRSMTGRYPNPGPLRLCDAGVYVLDEVGPEVMEAVRDGDPVELRDGQLCKGGRVICAGKILTRSFLARELAAAKNGLAGEMDAFVSNTIERAKVEKSTILGMLDFPPLHTSIAGRHSLVVVRGRDYREDLRAIRPYICEVRPVLIAVDGAADALLEIGFCPDIIVGDMDSVSDMALRRGCELVVHSYPNGRSPGRDRVRSLGLDAVECRIPGTSEDLALLLAYDKGAELIVAVGSHSTVEDFLDKGRPGMASTFLTRLKVGSILVDAKGVSKLYRGKLKGRHLLQVAFAALIPLSAAVASSGAARQLLRLMLVKLRLAAWFM